MELTTFFQKFDQFADAPDAVDKMRELVLELAVRGRLSERHSKDSNDPAWRNFLEKCDNRIYGSDPGPSPFEIPEEWRWVCVDDVSDACGQKKPDEPFTYIDVASVDNERGIIKLDLEVITPEHAPSRARKLVRLGTVIYATVRPYLRNIAVVDRDFSPSAIVSTAFAILHPRSFTNGRFLFYWLRSKSFETQVAKRMKGVAYPAINDGDFRGCPIPLPPLAEQKRIVAKVDELMALCDRQEAQQQERETRHAALARASLARFADAPTPANLNFIFHKSYAIPPADLRKSILTLAVQGKLVPQEPNDEPGEQILRRIHSGTSSKKAANGSMASDDLGELPFGLPNGWSVSRLGSILLPTRGISYGVIKLGPEPQQGGVFILRCSNVRFRRIDLNGIRKVTEQLSSEYGRTILEGGEVLINVRGTLGGCAVVPPALKGYNIAREVAVIPVHSEIDPTFLLNVIASPYFQDRVDENLRGIAYEGLNLGLLRDFLVPIPPLAEQRRIVAKVEQMMALVDALETQLAASRATAANLLSALVAELTVSSSKLLISPSKAAFIESEPQAAGAAALAGSGVGTSP